MENVSGIYALEPMTHLQTTNNYPDLAAIWTVQQFAQLNQITLSTNYQGWVPLTTHSYPLNVSFAGAVPSGVATPLLPCPGCQGLDFHDVGNTNETLITGIITANVPGFYVFSAPWETVNTTLANINTLKGYSLTIPGGYTGPNIIYALSITPSGSPSLATINSNLSPLSTYPVLPSPAPVIGACTQQAPFHIAVTAGTDGAVIPGGMNTNETFYMIRHAEAHPLNLWDDGNYVAAGQWRALDLPNALRGKISPDQVWANDPAQVYPAGTETIFGRSYWSYVRPPLTVEPYAIANNLPFNLAATFEIFAPDSPQSTIAFFFQNHQFSDHSPMLAWEHEHYPPTMNLLIASYFPNSPVPPADIAPDWPSTDYDTVWTLTLDSLGNLTLDNTTCEGINSVLLPPTAPQF